MIGKKKHPLNARPRPDGMQFANVAGIIYSYIVFIIHPGTAERST